jgi:hypothetical protein
MIAISRAAAGRFRALARRCVVGRPRGPAPTVHVSQSPQATTLFSDFGETALALALPGAGESLVKIAVPGPLLEEIERAKESAEISLGADLGRCRWNNRESNRESTWKPLAIADDAGPWDLPRDMKPAPATLFAALHECGRSAARDSGRLALKRLQLQGSAGRIVGSDGHQLLIWNSFRFPFDDSVLVPAVPAFGCKELLTETNVRIGQSDRHIVVTAGPWTIWLTIDRAGKYPNVEMITPKSPDSELHLTEHDVQIIESFLQHVIKEDDTLARVTIDFGERPTLRAKTEVNGRTSEVILKGSHCTGKARACALNRDFLTRALSLGLRRIGLQSDNGPAVCRDAQRTYVAVTMHPSTILSKSRPPAATTATPNISNAIQGEAMPSETNGRISPEPTHAEALDFLAEAEGLRDALADVARRAARLVVSLKHLQKQRRVMETAWSSLKNLRLGS